MKEVKSTGLEPSEVVSEINRLRAALEKEKEKSNRISETANENYRLIAELRKQREKYPTGLMPSGNLHNYFDIDVCLSLRRPSAAASRPIFEFLISAGV